MKNPRKKSKKRRGRGIKEEMKNNRQNEGPETTKDKIIEEERTR